MIKSNGKFILTRDQAVARAILASKDEGFRYGLGAGGRDPRAVGPYALSGPKLGRVDCSGFLAWGLGYDRFRGYHRQREVWVYTDSIEDDGRYTDKSHVSSNFGVEDLFRTIPFTAPVLPGDIIAYRGEDVLGERRPGHCAMIVEVAPGFSRAVKGWHTKVKIAHSTSTHRLKYGNCIAVTDAVAFRSRGWILRYTGFIGAELGAKLASLSSVAADPLGLKRAWDRLTRWGT